MSTCSSNKKSGIYESFTSINQSTNLENIYENNEINIPKQKYVNIGDYKNMNISIPEKKEPSPASVIIESDSSKDSISPSVISYIGTPSTDIKKENLNTTTSTTATTDEPATPPQKWDAITTFYVSALSVVGLFVVFRAIQKSK